MMETKSTRTLSRSRIMTENVQCRLLGAMLSQHRGKSNAIKLADLCEVIGLDRKSKATVSKCLPALCEKYGISIISGRNGVYIGSKEDPFIFRQHEFTRVNKYSTTMMEHTNQRKEGAF